MIPTQAEIDHRLARYAATLDASILWPEVPAHAFRAAQEEITRATAAILAGAPGPVPLAPPAGSDARALGVAAFAAGMGPLLGFWCEMGRIAAQPAVGGLLAVHLDHGRCRAARLRSELERLALALAARSIEVTALKGMHTAFEYFPDPGTRPMADMDLLVRPEHLDGMRVALPAMGYEVDQHGLWWPCGVSRQPRSLERSDADDPWSLDLHVTLDKFFTGRAAGFGQPQPSQLNGCDRLPPGVRVLAEPLLLAYLALHGSSHFFTMPLIRLVELVLVARRDFHSREEAWSALNALVEGGCARFVYPSLELAERLAPGTFDATLRKSLAGATPWQLRRLLARTTPGSVQRIYSQPFGGRYLWIASARDLFAAVGGFLWPQDRSGRVSLREMVEIQRARIVRVSWRIGRRIGRLMASSLRRRGT